MGTLKQLQDQADRANLHRIYAAVGINPAEAVQGSLTYTLNPGGLEIRWTKYLGIDDAGYVRSQPMVTTINGTTREAPGRPVR